MNQPVVLITGALTGIGRATAFAFAKDGARLVVSGRREADGKALEVELQRLGAEAVFIQADVRHDDEVGGLIDQAVAHFGRLDVAVNIAGSSGVRVNAVAPGPTDTGMLDRFTGTPEHKAALIAGVPLGRIGKPDDIANTVRFLAADATSFLTGQVVIVDGGKTAG